jgi:hypothetical protein
MDRSGATRKAEFQLDDVRYEQLSRRVEAWREGALQPAHDHQRPRVIRTTKVPTGASVSDEA